MKKVKTQQPPLRQASRTNNTTVSSALPVKLQEPRRQLSALTRREQGPLPVIRFAPTAWAKLLFFRDRDQVEVGGFGITRADDLLFVEEFVTVQQDVTGASIQFHDDAVADFFDAQVDVGQKPEQFGRVWCHTHPGESPTPSMTDEETFARVFGGCQWAIMFVLGRTGKTHARLRFNVGPGGEGVVPVEVDYSRPFGASDHEAWEAEYRVNILPAEWDVPVVGNHRRAAVSDFGSYGLADDLLEDLEAMEPEEREYVLRELANQDRDDGDVW